MMRCAQEEKYKYKLSPCHLYYQTLYEVVYRVTLVHLF